MRLIPHWPRALGLLFLVAASCGGGPTAPHVILISMDTLRADALGCYGAGGAASPHIDAFASGATRYEDCISTAPWTVPSHASLFTGLFPFEHGAISFDVQAMQDNVAPLAAEHRTLAEVLGEHGYRSAGFVANAVYLNPAYGLSQGFDEWVVAREPARELNEKVLAWLDAELERDASVPRFVFVNYLDTHRPYNVEPIDGEEAYPPTQFPSVVLDQLIDAVMVRGEEAPELRALVREQYARAVRNLDLAIGELLVALDARGLADDCVIVLTSDHGEYFGEHGLVEHSKDVYHEGVAVPLIVRAPGQSAGEVRTERASLVDVPALVAECLPEPLRGALRARFERLPGEHVVLTENHFSRPRDLLRPEYQGRFRRQRTALYTERYKYIHSTDGRHELFDLDVGESANRLEAEPEVAAKLSGALERALETGRWRGASGGAVELDDEHRRAMQALGYLGGDGEADGE